MNDIVSQNFTYDWYEKTFGDGFYPEPVEKITNENKDYKGVVIEFRIEGSYWVQVSGHSIRGLDGNFGIQTLNSLNKKYGNNLRVTAKMCMTRMKQHGMTDKVLSTPLNKLSKEEFVFRVVDEMVNCEWKAQAEYIMSLVGHPKIEHPIGIKNIWGSIIYHKSNNC